MLANDVPTCSTAQGAHEVLGEGPHRAVAEGAPRGVGALLEPALAPHLVAEAVPRLPPALVERPAEADAAHPLAREVAVEPDVVVEEEPLHRLVAARRVVPRVRIEGVGAHEERADDGEHVDVVVLALRRRAAVREVAGGERLRPVAQLRAVVEVEAAVAERGAGVAVRRLTRRRRQRVVGVVVDDEEHAFCVPRCSSNCSVGISFVAGP